MTFESRSSLAVSSFSHAPVGRLSEQIAMIPGAPLVASARSVVGEQVDGSVIVQGDIILSIFNDQHFNLSQQNMIGIGLQPYGIGIDHSAHLWPDGRVPYIWDDDILLEVVEPALEHLQSRTPIRFYNSSNGPAFVKFTTRGNRNSAHLGRRAGANLVSLHSRATVGDVLHEIGHVLGLWHEHTRSDANQFVKILSENIVSGYEGQFFLPDLSVESIGQYDIESIMHYPGNAFSSDPETLKTIVRVDGHSLPKQSGLSRGDQLSLRHLYPELDWSILEPLS